MPTARLDAALDRAIAERRIVGAVVMVAREGRTIYARAAGLADRETGREMTPDAIFRLASITKPYVTAALMRLVERGELPLHAPVTRWLRDFCPRLPDGTTPQITLAQLLTHSSGLGYRFLEPSGGAYHRLDISDGLDQPGLSLAENLARLVEAPLYFAPGTGWRYSLGLDVLGAVLEKVAAPLPELVAQSVARPLGMIDTAFAVTDPARLVTAYADHRPEPAPISDGMAIPLWEGAALFAPSRILDPASYPSAGAGMAGTAADALAFLEAIRQGGGPILRPGTVATMMRPQVRAAGARTQGPGWGFGYGWAVLENPAAAGTPQGRGTIQWGGAYGHSWFVDPEAELSVVALTNTAFEGMSGAFPGEIRDAVYGRTPNAKPAARARRTGAPR